MLFCLQEIIKNIEQHVGQLGGKSEFSQHHMVIKPDGSIPDMTHYQGLGFVTSFDFIPLTQIQLDIIGSIESTTFVKLNDYSFEMIYKNTDQSKTGRNIQMFNVIINDEAHIVINVHYHYNDSVNKFNNDIIEQLIDKLSPSFVMGDFNSNPVFKRYYDVLKGLKTFPTDINATDLLDHIFVRENIKWQFELCRKFDIKEVTGDALDKINQELVGKNNSYLKKKKLLENSYLVGVNDEFYSDHIVYIFKVITLNNTQFLMGTINILAPHTSTAHMLHPMMGRRVKDIGRIKELVDQINNIKLDTDKK